LKSSKSPLADSGQAISLKTAVKATDEPNAAEPQPKPSQGDCSRRGAEDAEKLNIKSPPWPFSALSATLRGKIFAEMKDFFLQWLKKVAQKGCKNPKIGLVSAY
jgi:hypothetical protein